MIQCAWCAGAGAKPISSRWASEPFRRCLRTANGAATRKRYTKNKYSSAVVHTWWRRRRPLQQARLGEQMLLVP